LPKIAIRPILSGESVSQLRRVGTAHRVNAMFVEHSPPYKRDV